MGDGADVGLCVVCVTTANRANIGKATIDMIPDNVLVEIFDFYRGDNEHFTTGMWKTLVHVCRRWRNIVFASSRHLHLLLVCDGRTPVKRLLNIWPHWPITIHYSPNDEEGQENIIAALERHDRIFWIVFNELTRPIFERFSTVMQESFPTLKGLHLQSFDANAPLVPSAFLGGSVPQLRYFFLDGITFPTLPQLVLSASRLTKLWLQRIPDAGYISPEVLASCLAVLSNLEELFIEFQYPQYHPLRIVPPPSSRAVLSALTYLGFRGSNEYLEDLISRVNAPNLDRLNVSFFMSPIFSIPELHSFIGSVERFKLLGRAYMELYPWSVRISLGSPTHLDLGTKCDGIAQRISSLAQLCNELSPLLSQVERLEIKGDSDPQVEPEVVMESAQWVELFRPFIAVQGLYVSKSLGPLVTQALESLPGESTKEVLPALRCLSLGGFKPPASIQDIMKPFATVRQLSDQPVTIERWERDLYWGSEDDGS